MYLALVMCSDPLYEEAKWFFLQQWRSDLLVKEPNSLIWAYLVTKYMRQNWKPWFSFIDWVYSCEDLYFSTSHSDDVLMIAVNNKKIAVDIEHINPRDESLLRSVRIAKSPYSKRENFYLQRTAKECLVKFLNLTNNEMKDMKIIKFDPHHHYSVDEREFSWLLTLWFRWNEYRVHVDIKNNRVMSLLNESTPWKYKINKTSQTSDNWNYLCSMERTGMFKPID